MLLVNDRMIFSLISSFYFNFDNRKTNFIFFISEFKNRNYVPDGRTVSVDVDGLKWNKNKNRNFYLRLIEQHDFHSVSMVELLAMMTIHLNHAGQWKSKFFLIHVSNISMFHRHNQNHFTNRVRHDFFSRWSFHLNNSIDRLRFRWQQSHAVCPKFWRKQWTSRF